MTKSEKLTTSLLGAVPMFATMDYHGPNLWKRRVGGLAREIQRLRATLDMIASPLSFDEDTHKEAVYMARRALAAPGEEKGR